MDDAHRLTALVPGTATGSVLMLDEPLSFWGGFDSETGLIVDRHHPQHGTTVTGTILFMAHGRGSSSASSVLAEAIRLGTAPAAVVLAEVDEILTLGSLVAHELYGIVTPVLLDRGGPDLGISTGDIVTVLTRRDGSCELQTAGDPTNSVIPEL